MRDEYTDRHGNLNRYFVRWITEVGEGGCLKQTAWQVCDRRKFDKIDLAMFKLDEKAQADAMCKLLNSIEEENDGVSK
jgi:hypothetical protein